MYIEENQLYILIEGEPDSPEVSWIERVIRKLVVQKKLPKIQFALIEIGGSGSFNSIANPIYSRSNLHKEIPILAITDRDFKSEQEIQEHRDRSDKNLVDPKTRSVRYLYWDRHEWENFLLDEIETIVNILNSLPLKPRNPISKRQYKTKDISLDKVTLDRSLKQYFQNNIKREFIECLRFRFRQRLYIELPRAKNDDLSDISTCRAWFEKHIDKKSEKYKKEVIDQKSVFDDILKELSWHDWWKDEGLLDFEQAKNYFRGKEALKELLKQCHNTVGLYPEIRDKTFIQTILLPELENNTDSLIVQQIAKMLKPYFEKVRDLI